jgi:hypothetical protein
LPAKRWLKVCRWKWSWRSPVSPKPKSGDFNSKDNPGTDVPSLSWRSRLRGVAKNRRRTKACGTIMDILNAFFDEDVQMILQLAARLAQGAQRP